jgi:tetratricopeptide (TPR) repeat protein
VQLTDQATGLLRQQRWEEAEAVARRALAALRGSSQLYEAYAEYDLGRALAEQGECDEALEHLDRSEAIQGQRSQIDDARSKCQ